MWFHDSQPSEGSLGSGQGIYPKCILNRTDPGEFLEINQCLLNIHIHRFQQLIPYSRGNLRGKIKMTMLPPPRDQGARSTCSLRGLQSFRYQSNPLGGSDYSCNRHAVAKVGNTLAMCNQTPRISKNALQPPANKA